MTNPAADTAFKLDLARRFDEQAQFAAGYSPLYQRIFATVARWLEGEAPNDVAAWLLNVAADRPPFDVTLLLPAALHREVLRWSTGAFVPDEVVALAQYFPSVGGQTPAEKDAAFDAILENAILITRERLGRFVQNAGVQTNETARGLAWLLPSALAGWRDINLVELGASAGLNLVAERRTYALVPVEAPDRLLASLGSGLQPQFITHVIGNPDLPFHQGRLRLPHVASRCGGDLAPFPLDTAEDELTLASFVWGDQPRRLERLREGLAAVRHANRGPTPVRVTPLRLPDELGRFMDEVSATNPPLPTVVYNTTMSMYLERRSLGLHEAMVGWAERVPHRSPLLWLQWEPPYDATHEPPEYGWLAWTADLWTGDEYHHWLLGWVHPHGTALRWESGLVDFLANL